MDEVEHGNYDAFFSYLTVDGQKTNIYARLQDSNKRPLFDKYYDPKASGDTTQAQGSHRLKQKKLERLIPREETDSSMIRARWFIKKDGQFQYPEAEVHTSVRMSFRTSLRMAIEKAKISDERKAKVKRMLHERPGKFKEALKEFMAEKEVDYMEAQVVEDKKGLEEYKKIDRLMDEYAQKVKEKCQAATNNND